MTLDEWLGPDADLGGFIEAERESRLSGYRTVNKDVTEHANIEAATAQGAYGRRQLHELIQNGADAIMESGLPGKIHVVLTDEALYCANEGAPLARSGAEAILHSHMSEKRGTEIGRFGLGFKSVLAISSKPRFYSRTGSFYFDESEARAVIGEVVPGLARYPILRVAFPVNPQVDARRDETLAELMRWATTVVELPRTNIDGDMLDEDLAAFPAEFMLFSPHVERLILEDRTRSDIRNIQLTKVGRDIVLSDRESPTRWRVFQTVHRPSAAAKKDAGELAKRTEVPLMWAVPMEVRKDDGQFWAFFPTEYGTTLKGILNCPWKTNEDRTNLLDGPFNQELISVAARLIGESAAQVCDKEEPARFLDVMNARGDEARNWADKALTEEVYAQAALNACLPDQEAVLSLPEELWIHPDQLGVEALEAWARVPARPINWVHTSVGTRNARNRRPRVERLAGSTRVASVGAWLEALAGPSDVSAAAEALNVANLVLDDETRGRSAAVEQSRIVLLADGSYARASDEGVYLPSSGQKPRAGVKYVNAELAADPVTRAILERLGLHEVSAEALLEDYLVTHANRSYAVDDWATLWGLVGGCEPDAAADLIRGARLGYRNDPLHVLTRSGEWRPLPDLLLPGPVVPVGAERDTRVAIDTKFHGPHLGALQALGARSTPGPGGGSTRESWFIDFLQACRNDFRAHQVGSPQADYLKFENTSFTGPLSPLLELSAEGRAEYTQAFLEADHSFLPYRMRHTTQDRYTPMDYEDPAKQMLAEHGILRTQHGLTPLSECVVGELRPLGEAFAVPDLPDEYLAVFDLPSCFDDLDDDDWASAYNRVLESANVAGVTAFYAAAAQYSDVYPPVMLAVVSGRLQERAAESVTVTCNPVRAAALQRDGIPFLRVATLYEEQTLVARWGLKSGDDVVSVEVETVEPTVVGAIADEYRGMESFLEGAADMQLVRCEEVFLTTLTDSGRTSEAVDFYVQGETAYATASLGVEEVLRRLNQALDLRMLPADIQAVLRSEDNQRLRKVKTSIRDAETVPEKLAAALGVHKIIRRLPRALVREIDGIESDRTGVTAAAAALSIFGVDVFRQYRDDLSEIGLHVPRQWAGSHAARQFCRELAVPPEFAGFEGEDRRPNWDVDGPSPLPPPHDYQEVVVERIRELIWTGAEDSGPRRGMLSLPTGAGKTRVAVEAICRELSDQSIRSVIWIAQSDELCEQAVKSWYHIWRAVGVGRMRISRLWSDNEVDQAPDGSAQVIVATIDKLEAVRKRTARDEVADDEQYGWLQNVGLIVVDEAHSSITSEYTKVLEWLGLGRSQRQDRCPLLGLTATPYKGTSAEQTERLVHRYGRLRLDEGLFEGDPYTCLQEERILARVEHKLLEGVQIVLSADELAQLSRTRRLPSSVGIALADNRERNRAILDSIAGHPADWSILLFATSVEHAQIIAAMLDSRGISARSVSSDTRPGVRRHYVSQFRNGEIRVLTNYGVLTEGFDAPATRAIYVTRPTFSPNVYQQMIGRGLRGPKNQGTEECLIVNVQDTVANFGDQLAFTKFEHLWAEK